MAIFTARTSETIRSSFARQIVAGAASDMHWALNMRSFAATLCHSAANLLGAMRQPMSYRPKRAVVPAVPVVLEPSSGTSTGTGLLRLSGLLAFRSIG